MTVDIQRLSPGDVVEGFRLDQLLRTGGMSSIWRVSRADVDFPAILKIPFLRYDEDQLSIVSFETEKIILPRLHGPHFPRFAAAGSYDNPFIAMEFIVGMPLEAWLERLPLEIDEVVRLGAKIATALQRLHEQHVIHLDLKPDNVILRPTGDAVLIDFGFARHDQLPDLLAEEFEDPVGTGPYISPEQVLGVRTDPRSDLFALGVILYLLATGKQPFGEPAHVSGWRRRLYVDPEPPRKLNGKIPAWLQEIILRSIEVDPNDRYPTAAQLAFDLQHPGQVLLSARAEKMTAGGFGRALSRWLKFRRTPPFSGLKRQLASAPIIAVAIDLADRSPLLLEAIRTATQRILATVPDARLACLYVFKISRVQIDDMQDETGRNIFLRRLAELEHWSQPLAVNKEKITYQVLEAVDPAAALINYARENMIDHLIVGARTSSTVRRYLGSVSAKIVAEAPCTVTVVRPKTHT